MPLPTISPAAAPTHDTDDQQQDQCSNCGVGDCGNKSYTKMNADLREKPVPNERAQDSNEEIAENTKPCTFDYLTSEPACNEANNQNNDETFI